MTPQTIHVHHVCCSGARFELSPGTHSGRRNSLHLPANTLYGCHTGGLVHSAMGWEDHEVGEVDWTRWENN